MRVIWKYNPFHQSETDLDARWWNEFLTHLGLGPEGEIRDHFFCLPEEIEFLPRENMSFFVGDPKGVGVEFKVDFIEYTYRGHLEVNTSIESHHSNPTETVHFLKEKFFLMEELAEWAKGKAPKPER